MGNLFLMWAKFCVFSKAADHEQKTRDKKYEHLHEFLQDIGKSNSSKALLSQSRNTWLSHDI